jgi:hypothetical protein
MLAMPWGNGKDLQVGPAKNSKGASVKRSGIRARIGVEQEQPENRESVIRYIVSHSRNTLRSFCILAIMGLPSPWSYS